MYYINQTQIHNKKDKRTKAKVHKLEKTLLKKKTL